jgi:NAD(P)H-hydrate epimerase
MLIDADALNILSENKTWLSFIPQNSIFTPHLGEFKRLIVNTEDSFDRLKAQIEFSKKFECIVILKGPNSQISLPDGRVYYNSTGNPGMATAGSWDVLSGLITGLLARKYHPMYAAILGVYLHGLAGDIAAEKLGEEAMNAGDIIESIPLAFQLFEV